tara:strand:- start:90 stop:1157 length:1068 start_codon:yes stop_codon:yes gene_type:complete
MDISNQNKLSEFYEELKRLNIDIVRPDINDCFADFRTDGKIFFYALGGVKAVGYEAVSNIVEEREKNGKFNSINDFINRVSPKDINKLQLEGLVKAGAFDNINSNRQSLFLSIPNLIKKSKNIYENKSTNQINLFEEDKDKDEELITKIDDWNFEERLSKEFESVGFFISDHPLNQFKEIFKDYNIYNFEDFNNNNGLTNSNIAATLLKIQERKTAKGNSYAVLKLTDLTSVFELFIFSEVLEKNREILKDGSSLILTLIKSSSEENRFKRINVQKIASLYDLLNRQIEEVTFKIKSSDELTEISKSIPNNGNTIIKIKISNQENEFSFTLKNKRNIDRKMLNILRNKEISAIIR